MKHTGESSRDYIARISALPHSERDDQDNQALQAMGLMNADKQARSRETPGHAQPAVVSSSEGKRPSTLISSNDDAKERTDLSVRARPTKRELVDVSMDDHSTPSSSASEVTRGFFHERPARARPSRPDFGQGSQRDKSDYYAGQLRGGSFGETQNVSATVGGLFGWTANVPSPQTSSNNTSQPRPAAPDRPNVNDTRIFAIAARYPYAEPFPEALVPRHLREELEMNRREPYKECFRPAPWPCNPCRVQNRICRFAEGEIECVECIIDMKTSDCVVPAFAPRDIQTLTRQQVGLREDISDLSKKVDDLSKILQEFLEKVRRNQGPGE